MSDYLTEYQAGEALRRWFHGTPAAPYAYRGHDENASECQSCSEAAEVVTAAAAAIRDAVYEGDDETNG